MLSIVLVERQTSMERSDYKDDLEWVGKTSKPIHVIIVGAGVAGLSLAIGKHLAAVDLPVCNT